jgi:hypothetical protein
VLVRDFAAVGRAHTHSPNAPPPTTTTAKRATTATATTTDDYGMVGRGQRQGGVMAMEERPRQHVREHANVFMAPRYEQTSRAPPPHSHTPLGQTRGQLLSESTSRTNSRRQHTSSCVTQLGAAAVTTLTSPSRALVRAETTDHQRERSARTIVAAVSPASATDSPGARQPAGPSRGFGRPGALGFAVLRWAHLCLVGRARCHCRPAGGGSQRRSHTTIETVHYYH